MLAADQLVNTSRTFGYSYQIAPDTLEKTNNRDQDNRSLDTLAQSKDTDDSGARNLAQTGAEQKSFSIENVIADQAQSLGFSPSSEQDQSSPFFARNQQEIDGLKNGFPANSKDLTGRVASYLKFASSGIYAGFTAGIFGMRKMFGAAPFSAPKFVIKMLNGGNKVTVLTGCTMTPDFKRQIKPFSLDNKRIMEHKRHKVSGGILNLSEEQIKNIASSFLRAMQLVSRWSEKLRIPLKKGYCAALQNATKLSSSSMEGQACGGINLQLANADILLKDLYLDYTSITEESFYTLIDRCFNVLEFRIDDFDQFRMNLEGSPNPIVEAKTAEIKSVYSNKVDSDLIVSQFIQRVKSLDRWLYSMIADLTFSLKSRLSSSQESDEIGSQTLDPKESKRTFIYTVAAFLCEALCSYTSENVVTESCASKNKEMEDYFFKLAEAACSRMGNRCVSRRSHKAGIKAKSLSESLPKFR